ncbi:hypothetical protein Sjap_021295 [Stephania japonica]|uniref:Uncharacterized protein n=1 Tax=Stephania japonica TaxID=461633 RepID=A0AAP0ETW5_9MAGN
MICLEGPLHVYLGVPSRYLGLVQVSGLAQEKTREGAIRRSSSITVSAKERGRRGVVPTTPPLPLFPLRQSAREATTLWPAAGGPFWRVETTEGGGGRGRGGEHKLHSTTANVGDASSPLPG